MKKTHATWVIHVFLALSLPALISCESSDGITGDNGDKNGDHGGIVTTREAYETVIDFSIKKQAFMYDFLEIMSDNYTAPFLENDLTYEQIDDLFSSLYSLADYEDDIENALAVIESESGSTAKTAQAMRIQGLGNALRKLFSWMSGSGERNRNRILAVASNITAQERTTLYKDLRPDWKAQVKNENEYWQKLEDGEFDYDAGQMYNDFFHNTDTGFYTVAQKKDLRTIKIAVREGAEGIKEGVESMVEIAKTAASTVTGGLNLVEKVDKYRKTAATLFVDPKKIQEDVKNAVSEKIGTYTDVDGVVDGEDLGESVSPALQAVNDFAMATEEPSEIAGKGIDWGGVHILQAAESKDASDIAIAQSSDAGVVPATVIAMAPTDENINVVVPEGSWDLKVVATDGTSDTIEDMTITAGETVQIEAPSANGNVIIPLELEIAPSPLTGEPEEVISLTAETTGTTPDKMKYVWDFGDGSGTVTNSDDNSASHTYSNAGEYTITLKLYDADTDKLKAEATGVARIQEDYSELLALLHEYKTIYIYFIAGANHTISNSTDPDYSDEYVGPINITFDTCLYYTGQENINEYPLIWDGTSFSITTSYNDRYEEKNGKYHTYLEKVNLSGEFSEDCQTIVTLVADHEYNKHTYTASGVNSKIYDTISSISLSNMSLNTKVSRYVDEIYFDDSGENAKDNIINAYHISMSVDAPNYPQYTYEATYDDIIWNYDRYETRLIVKFQKK